MIVYIATNQVNGKVYIGQTVKTLNIRKNNHISVSNSGCSIYFHNAIRKHGADNFKWETIRICDNIESLNVFEQYYILYYNSMDRGVGYNMTSGGLNYAVSDETKEKIRQANLGKKLTEEHKKKLGKSKLGNKNRLGIKHTKESKEKMSKNSAMIMLGKHHTEESKKKMGRLGRIVSKETREKISAAQLGKKLSEETKNKIRESQLKYWKNKKENKDGQRI